MEWKLPNEKKIKEWALLNGFEKELKELETPDIWKIRMGKSSSKAETLLQRLRIKYIQSNKPSLYKRIQAHARKQTRQYQRRTKHALFYEQRTKKTRNRLKKYKENSDPRYEKVIQRAREFSFGLKLKFSDMLGGKCAICGYDLHPCALQFHHLNPKDKWSSTTFSGYLENPKRFEKDIKAGKIQLLCSNCHHIVHFNQKRGL